MKTKIIIGILLIIIATTLCAMTIRAEDNNIKMDAVIYSNDDGEDGFIKNLYNELDQIMNKEEKTPQEYDRAIDIILKLWYNSQIKRNDDYNKVKATTQK